MRHSISGQSGRRDLATGGLEDLRDLTGDPVRVPGQPLPSLTLGKPGIGHHQILQLTQQRRRGGGASPIGGQNAIHHLPSVQHDGTRSEAIDLTGL